LPGGILTAVPYLATEGDSDTGKTTRDEKNV
jgi:hypothetical protein